MSNPIVYLVDVVAAFLLAGLVKGVAGLALFLGRTWRSEVFGEH
jgi:hypothetical protein